MDFATISVSCPADLSELLIAELFEIGFDSFQELEAGFQGSCELPLFDNDKVSVVLSQYEGVSYSINEEEKVNWNEEWEKNYDPVIINESCIVRASFHPPRPEFNYEIVVTPKMSFGTGHHATTALALTYLMDQNLTGKKVLDVGTGTGILAIMASLRGANHILATDIDDWCIENSLENFSLNNVHAKVIKGEIALVEDRDFDVIIANINKNVLASQMAAYSERLSPSGTLLLSGFYEDDNMDLIAIGKQLGLEKVFNSAKDGWSVLVFSKPSV